MRGSETSSLQEKTASLQAQVSQVILTSCPRMRACVLASVCVCVFVCACMCVCEHLCVCARERVLAYVRFMSVIAYCSASYRNCNCYGTEPARAQPGADSGASDLACASQALLSSECGGRPGRPAAGLHVAAPSRRCRVLLFAAAGRASTPGLLYLSGPPQ